MSWFYGTSGQDGICYWQSFLGLQELFDTVLWQNRCSLSLEIHFYSWNTQLDPGSKDLKNVTVLRYLVQASTQHYNPYGHRQTFIHLLQSNSNIRYHDWTRWLDHWDLSSERRWNLLQLDLIGQSDNMPNLYYWNVQHCQDLVG